MCGSFRRSYSESFWDLVVGYEAVDGDRAWFTASGLARGEGCVVGLVMHA